MATRKERSVAAAKLANSADKLLVLFGLKDDGSTRNSLMILVQDLGFDGACAHLLKSCVKVRCAYCKRSPVRSTPLVELEGVEGPIHVHNACLGKMHEERSPMLYRDRGQARLGVVPVSEEEFRQSAARRMRNVPAGSSIRDSDLAGRKHGTRTEYVIDKNDER